MLILGVVVAFVGWQVSSALWRDDPNDPPATVYWNGCPYSRGPTVDTLESATNFEHGAYSYRNLSLKQVGSDGGLAIYALPIEPMTSNPCDGPWFIHLKVGADRYVRYQRPGGP